MADKDELRRLLSGDPPRAIRRGRGVRLSIEDAPAAETQERTSASPQESASASPQERMSASPHERTSASPQESRSAETHKYRPASPRESVSAPKQERTSASPHERTSALTHERGIVEKRDGDPAPKRVNRGYMLREDVVRDLRVLAVLEGRKLYEVMEEALTWYLAQRWGDAAPRDLASAQQRIIAETQERASVRSQERRIAETQHDANAPQRVNRGYMLREDVVRDLRVLAVLEGRKLYEVKEEALTWYMAQRRST